MRLTRRRWGRAIRISGTKPPSSRKTRRAPILKRAAKLLINLVNGTAGVTDAQKAELGLNVRAKPTPIPRPELNPTVVVVSVSGWTVKLRLCDQASSANRGKPAGRERSVDLHLRGRSAADRIGGLEIRRQHRTDEVGPELLQHPRPRHESLADGVLVQRPQARRPGVRAGEHLSTRWQRVDGGLGKC